MRPKASSRLNVADLCGGGPALHHSSNGLRPRHVYTAALAVAWINRSIGLNFSIRRKASAAVGEALHGTYAIRASKML
jgi:hypothetical protein